MKPARFGRAMSDSFGLPGIFDNVRDGLVLVRFPLGEIVLFNRAAGELCDVDPSNMLGSDFASLLPDSDLQATARRAAEQAVGEWPGHDQPSLPTTIHGPRKDTPVEVNVCRVEDSGTGGPLVLLVMRPSPDAAVEATIHQLATAAGPQAA